MHPKILIFYAELDTDLSRLPVRSMKPLHMASIVIVSDGTYFRCLKNRYSTYRQATDEKIPLALLTAYLMQYQQYFTKEDLFAALAYETTS